MQLCSMWFNRFSHYEESCETEEPVANTLVTLFHRTHSNFFILYHSDPDIKKEGSSGEDTMNNSITQERRRRRGTHQMPFTHIYMQKKKKVYWLTIQAFVQSGCLRHFFFRPKCQQKEEEGCYYFWKGSLCCMSIQLMPFCCLPETA